MYWKNTLKHSVCSHPPCAARPYPPSVHQEEIPSLSIPLHTVIELTPMPDGTNSVEYIPVPVSATGLEASFTEAPPAGLILPAGAESLMPSPARVVPQAVQASSGSSGSGAGSFSQQEGGGADKGEDLRRLCSCSSRHSLITHITASSVGSLGSTTTTAADVAGVTEPLLQPAAVVAPASC